MKLISGMWIWLALVMNLPSWWYWHIDIEATKEVGLLGASPQHSHALILDWVLVPCMN